VKTSGKLADFPQGSPARASLEANFIADLSAAMHVPAARFQVCLPACFSHRSDSPEQRSHALV
jgi:hypothetical protein